MTVANIHTIQKSIIVKGKIETVAQVEKGHSQQTDSMLSVK